MDKVESRLKAVSRQWQKAAEETFGLGTISFRQPVNFRTAINS